MGMKMDCSDFRHHLSWSNPDLIRLPAGSGSASLDSSAGVADHARRLTHLKRLINSNEDIIHQLLLTDPIEFD